MRAGKEDISRLWFLAGVSTDKNVRCPRMQPLCWVGEGVGTGMGLLKDRRYTYGTEHPRINQMILEKQGALGPDCVAIFRGKIQFHGKAQGQSSYAPLPTALGPLPSSSAMCVTVHSTSLRWAQSIQTLQWRSSGLFGETTHEHLVIRKWVCENKKHMMWSTLHVLPEVRGRQSPSAALSRQFALYDESTVKVTSS